MLFQACPIKCSAKLSTLLFFFTFHLVSEEPAENAEGMMEADERSRMNSLPACTRLQPE
jgi:hypothetical protein